MTSSTHSVIKRGDPEYQKEMKLASMADAMQLARDRLREEPDEDPDPYGYGQELEQLIGIDILPSKWKSSPDDTRWVKRLKGRARRAVVAKLFLQGHDVAHIAEKVQVSQVTILKDLTNLGMEWRRSYIDDIEILAGKDLARLDMLLTKLSPAIERGDTKSIVAAIEIIKERGSILGYRQGVQIDIEQYVREVAEANGFDPERAVQIATRVSYSLK